MEKTHINDIPKKLPLGLTYLIVMNVVGGIVFLIAYKIMLIIHPNNPNNEIFSMTLANFLAYYILTFVFVLLLREFYKSEFIVFKKKIFTYFGIAIVGYFCNLFLSSIIQSIYNLFDFTPRDTVNQESIAETLKYPLLSIPMIIFGAPLVEETIFRGVIFNACKNLKLKNNLNIILGFILSSSLFGLIHVLSAFLSTGDVTELILVFPYVAAGFVLTFLYYKTGNLFVPMLMHFLQNSIAVALMLLLQLFTFEEVPLKTLIDIVVHYLHLFS